MPLWQNPYAKMKSDLGFKFAVCSPVCFPIINPMLNAEIIAIGSEMLTPFRVDTNSLWLTERLNALGLSTTLVVTLQKNVNDDEIGKIIEFALQQKCVRGVTFQPTQIAGRTENFDPSKDRLTLTEVRQAILDQSKIFTAGDLIPVPCNPDALVMGYALKLAGNVFPLTRYVDPSHLLNSSRNTIVYEQDTALHEKMISIFSTGISVDRVEENMHQLLCCLPQIQAPGLAYENLFRIIIMRFVDAYDFDVRAIKKSCVHIVHKDGRIIPFETMNLFYRDEKENIVNRLREERSRLLSTSNS